MNLQENIYRIQGLMVTEGKSGTVKDMIEKHGLRDTIKLMGGYDRVKRMMSDIKISREEKINAIIERIIDFNQSIGDDENNSVWFTDIGSEPIEYEGTNDSGLRYDYQQIEAIYPYGVLIYGYRDKYANNDMGSFERKYEDLSDEEIDEILNTII